MKSLFWQIGDAARGVGSMALKGVDKAVSKIYIHLGDDSPLLHMAFSGHSWQDEIFLREASPVVTAVCL